MNKEIIGENAIWRLIWEGKALMPETAIFYIMVATVLFGLAIFIFSAWYRTCERGFHEWSMGKCIKCKKTNFEIFGKKKNEA